MPVLYLGGTTPAIIKGQERVSQLDSGRYQHSHETCMYVADYRCMGWTATDHSPEAPWMLVSLKFRPLIASIDNISTLALVRAASESLPHLWKFEMKSCRRSRKHFR
jgi:hypothetical protein